MADEKFIIPIDAIENDFSEFLNLQNNSRIIFSGPFGIGKTYFLDKFFGSRTDQYYPVFLRPINYSLLSNEDVFKLIKYDILYQIIKDNQFVFEELPDFSKMNYFQFFASQNKFLVLRNLLRMLPKIKDVATGVEEISKLFQKFDEGWKQINANQELEILKNFQVETETNFLLEYDEISDLIASQLDRIVTEKTKEGTNPDKILIVDDLDRLDPEHIFRLFNVFSAHFDQVNYRLADDGENLPENKFGFDKIIFVCDIENIRKIFAHKYGEGVDFSGYIDKFYSKQIFYLLHKDAFQKHIQKYIDLQFQNICVFDNARTKKIIFYMIQSLFEGKQLSIRDIIRLGNIHLSDLIANNKIKDIDVHLDKIGAPIYSFIAYYPICISIYILSKLFGNSSIFWEKFNKAIIISSTITNDYESESYEFDRIMPGLILFADFENHQFNVDADVDLKKENQKTYELKGNTTIKYSVLGNSINDHYRDESPMYFSISIVGSNAKLSKASFLKMLALSTKVIIEKGVITV